MRLRKADHDTQVALQISCWGRTGHRQLINFGCCSAYWGGSGFRTHIVGCCSASWLVNRFIANLSIRKVRLLG